MFDFLKAVFSVGPFVPHGHCYLWKTGLVGLHITADALIALAYYSIPFALLQFVQKRKDLPFKWIFLLFGIFIISCGTTHILEIWTLWHPTYWLSGIIKAITAVVSVWTAIELIPLLPKVLALSSPAELQQLNEQLQVSQTRVAGILDTASDAIISVDAGQNITLFNRAAEKMFGYAAAEVLEKPLDLLLPHGFSISLSPSPNDAQGQNDNVQDLKKSDTSWGCRRDGSLFPVEASCSELEVADEKIFTLFLHDITQRQQAEIALQKQLSLAAFRADVDASLTRSETLQNLLHSCTEAMVSHLDAAFARIWVLNAEENLLELQASSGLYTHIDGDHARVPVGKFKIGLIAQERQPHLTNSVLDDPRVSNKAWAKREGLIAFAGYPLVVEDQLLGVIAMFSQQPLSPATLDALALVSQEIALGIKRQQTETALRQSEIELREKAQQQEQLLHELQRTQAQLVQTEKMSSLGQLVAGVAHEINNPVNFIYGNLFPAGDYAHDLLQLLELYQVHYPNPVPAIQAEIEEIDLDFIKTDLPKLLASMKLGADRIQKIVLALRTFSRMDEAEVKEVNIHDGIDSTLMILQSRLKETAGHPEIKVIKQYGDVPPIECYAGQLNQVFMNILSNAIDAIDEHIRKCSCDQIQCKPATIQIVTEKTHDHQIQIQISDNAGGISEHVKQRLFEPFFTTKPIGKGTGLGLSISYQVIVEKHGGKLSCHSDAGQGTQFVIELPVKLKQLALVR